MRAMGEATSNRIGHDPPLVELFSGQRPAFVLLARIVLDDPAEAEDVVSDVFGKLLVRAERLPHGDGLVAYVRACILNRARTVARRRHRHRHEQLADDIPVPFSVADQVVRYQEYRAVLAAVRALPRRQMTVLILRYWHDMKIEDVAASLGITAGAVKSHGFKALKSVRRTLEGAGYGPLT